MKIQGNESKYKNLTVIAYMLDLDPVHKNMGIVKFPLSFKLD